MTITNQEDKHRFTKLEKKQKRHSKCIHYQDNQVECHAFQSKLPKGKEKFCWTHRKHTQA